MKTVRMTATARRGAVLVAAVGATVVLSLTVLALARLLDYNAHQSTYITNRHNLYRLCETGMNDALSQLMRDSDPTNFESEEVKNAELGGIYSSTVELREVKGIHPMYYVVTSATVTIAGRKVNNRFHSYVRVSNAGEFAIASKHELQVSAGVKVENKGRVYAPQLHFLTKSGVKTDIYCAEFTDTVRPTLLNLQEPCNDPSDDKWEESYMYDRVKIHCHPNKVPMKLNSPILFPQVFSSDLKFWKERAGSTSTSIFSGDIKQPGGKHIYYYDGDMHIKGTVHGKILFVATGNIYITGHLEKAALSNAHQAVLITPKTVFINNTFVTSVPTSVRTQRIQAMIMAPSPGATFEPVYYENPETHRWLKLDFHGSIVVNRLSRLRQVFSAPEGNNYGYDSSFREDPPPYLPALAEIYYMLEEVGPGAGIFN